jgi:hypothetical protein
VGLFQLGGQGMTVVGVPRKGSGTDDQALSVGDGDTGFTAEFIGASQDCSGDSELTA